MGFLFFFLYDLLESRRFIAKVSCGLLLKCGLLVIEGVEQVLAEPVRLGIQIIQVHTIQIYLYFFDYSLIILV